jgi:hypothetical protein
MVIHYKIPMLFYDCLKRTYKFTEWNDERVQKSILTSISDPQHNTAKKNRSIGVDHTSTHPNVATFVTGTTTTTTNNNDRAHDVDDLSSTQEESEVDDDDDDDELFRHWMEQSTSCRQLIRHQAMTETGVETSSKVQHEISETISSGKRQYNHQCQQFEREPIDTNELEQSPLIDSKTQRNQLKSTSSNRNDFMQNILDEALLVCNQLATTTESVNSLSSSCDDDNDGQDRIICEQNCHEMSTRFKPNCEVITNQVHPPMPTIPFISLDIQWDSFGELKTSRNYSSNHDDDGCEEDRNDNNNNEIITRQRIARYNFERSEPAAGAAVLNNIKLRIPIPTLISFATMAPNNITTITTTNDNERELHPSPDDDIYDPTDPLIYGSIDGVLYESLKVVSQHMYQRMIRLHNSTSTDANDIYRLALNAVKENQNAVYTFIQDNPISCQVKYLIPGYRGPCYPISYFCSIGLVRGFEVAYDAYPEAIGHYDAFVGTPLHYALLYNTNIALIERLLQYFPEAVRITNHPTEKRTPLHFACINHHSSTDNAVSSFPNLKVIELLMRYYPSAVQLSDNVNGMTPVHAVCQWQQYFDDEESNKICNLSVARKVLQSFLETSPMAVHAVTADMQKPLHIAASYGAPTEVLELILQFDPSQIKFSDDHFQTPLHKAVQAAALEATTMTDLLLSSSSTPPRRRYSTTDCLFVLPDDTVINQLDAKDDHKGINVESKPVRPLSNHRQQLLKNNIQYLVHNCPIVLTATDENDETPLELAIRLGCSTEIIEILQGYK